MPRITIHRDFRKLQLELIHGRWIHPLPSFSNCRYRNQSTASVTAPDLASFLSRPSWSVRSLLPDSAAPDSSTEAITSKQLRDLLRLAALPAPTSEDEERKMLQTLSSQLHFVKKIQSVDTTDVEPLRSIRDETQEAIRENTLTVEKLRHAFDKEEVKGWTRRIERKKSLVSDPETKRAEDWDVLGQAKRKVGRFFVVETIKSQQ
ncbi:MAG: hypothetical protein M1816_003420 [Peltula sp. TS41687]|nr:MAG: hypothetical protein M1816_003420 [Peltula sp. TS41687]